MADSSRKTSISPLLFYALSLPVRAFKNTANWTFVQFRENESLRSCARIYSVAFRSSFRKLLTIGNVWRDQISKRISRFVAIVIGVNKNIRESTFIDLFLFTKILENSNILDDWTIAIFLVLDKQKTDWNSTEIRKFVNCVNEIFSGVFLYVTRIVCPIFRRYREIESKIKNISN